MENLTRQKESVIEIKCVEIKEENESKTEPEKSIEEKKQLFILAQDPHEIFYDENDHGFNYEEESESNNNNNPELDSSYHGDNSIKTEQDEENSNFDEYDDPLAQLDALNEDHDDDDKSEDELQQQQQSEGNSGSSTRIINSSLQQENKSSEFSCPNCPANFPSYEELVQHEKIPHNPQLKQHVNLKNKKSSKLILEPFQCSHGCGKEFKTTVELYKHRKKFHDSKSDFELIFKCWEPGCSLQFKQKEKRDAHWEKEHKVSFICPEKELGCSREFFNKLDFDNHTRAHKLPPPVTWDFVCRYCSPRRPFLIESSLEEHIQVKHAHPCPFDVPDSSSGCPPFFQSAFLRDIHMLEKHQDEQDCPIESQKYPTLSAASSFLRCNHGNCSIQFNTRSKLFTHIKEEEHYEHTYTCPAFSCLYSTVIGSSIFLHFVNYPHHDPCNPDFQPHENPWSCPVCQDSDECQSPSSLQKHAVAEHKFLHFPCPFGCPENLENLENNDNDKDSENKTKPMKCGMIFDTYNKLKLHWKRYSEHFPQDPELWLDWLKSPIPIKCSQEDCSEEFMSQSEMKAHFLSHPTSNKLVPTYIIGSGMQKPRARGHKLQKRKEQDNKQVEPQELPTKRRVAPPQKLSLDNAFVKKTRNDIKVKKRRRRKKVINPDIIPKTEYGKKIGRPINQVKNETEPKENQIQIEFLMEEMDNSE